MCCRVVGWVQAALVVRKFLTKNTEIFVMEEPEVSLSNALRRLIQKRFTEKVAEKSNDTKSEPGGGKAGDKSEKQPTSLLASARLNRVSQARG